MAVDKALRKYLEGFAEPEAEIAQRLGGPFAEVLTIPSYGEGDGLLGALRSVPPSPRGAVLSVVVLNARADSGATAHEANGQSQRALIEAYGEGRRLDAAARLFEHPAGPLLLLDRAHEPRFLPPGQGVGLARKIGADVALALCARDQLESPWIHCTDADARLPADYFDQASGAPEDASALVHRFRHGRLASDGIHPPRRAALEYEASLRYWVEGLRHADSPYAFHTIGSTMSLRATHYARVRGFPRRMAAEDFHLLAKLRKQGPVCSLAGDPLWLSDRGSERVPFGTGAAMRRSTEEALRTYDPGVFDALRVWLSVLAQAANDPDTKLAPEIAKRSPDGLGEALVTSLEELGALERAARALPVETSPTARLRRLHEGFDALKTLKLIHALRDRALPNLPIAEALLRAPFVDTSDGAALDVLRDRLEQSELQSPPPRV